MRSLGSTTARLSRYRKQWEKIVAANGQAGPEGAAAPSHLRDIPEFGSNPGRLKLLAHVPERLAASPALVVVLHGCTQNAAGYDRGCGWSTLADAHGFIVAFPEQQAQNNPRTCFNWFQPGDIARGRGEAVSIKQMVDHLAKTHGVDRRRVFVTGLSAGGAMTAVMLAAYPDVFAGGAVIAGLPYGAARDVRDALDAMYQGKTLPAAEWGDRVRAASRHRGPWPRVSIWHGGADETVKPVNAIETIKQWTNVHGLLEQPSRRDRVDGVPREVWNGPDGEALVESYTIPGMAHGTPLATDGADALGTAGPFLLDVGISSTRRIAEFFGITGEAAKPAAARPAAADPLRSEPPKANPTKANPPKAKPDGSGAPAFKVLEGEVLPPRSEEAPGTGERSEEHRTGTDPGKVITDALKAAGLMPR